MQVIGSHGQSRRARSPPNQFSCPLTVLNVMLSLAAAAESNLWVTAQAPAHERVRGQAAHPYSSTRSAALNRRCDRPWPSSRPHSPNRTRNSRSCGRRLNSLDDVVVVVVMVRIFVWQDARSYSVCERHCPRRSRDVMSRFSSWARRRARAGSTPTLGTLVSWMIAIAIIVVPADGPPSLLCLPPHLQRQPVRDRPALVQGRPL